jgi:hypothetical protein
VLAIVIMDGMATRRRIEEVRGAASLSLGPEGPVSLPRDSSETLGPARLPGLALGGARRSCDRTAAGLPPDRRSSTRSDLVASRLLRLRMPAAFHAWRANSPCGDLGGDADVGPPDSGSEVRRERTARTSRMSVGQVRPVTW